MIVLSPRGCSLNYWEIKSLCTFVDRHAASQVSDEQYVLKPKISLSMVAFPSPPFTNDGNWNCNSQWPNEACLAFLVIKKALYFLRLFFFIPQCLPGPFPHKGSPIHLHPVSYMSVTAATIAGSWHYSQFLRVEISWILNQVSQTQTKIALKMFWV